MAVKGACDNNIIKILIAVGLIRVNAHARVHPVISSYVPWFEGEGIHRTRRVKSATGEALTKENDIKERKSQCCTWLMNEDNPRF